MGTNLDKLIEVSARVGRNIDLVQAGGGNTSIKEDGILWVKASGKWLARADQEEMFLPVPMADIERQLAAEDEKFPEYRTRDRVALRPSVETAVHAVLPHKAVIHVHSVRTIAWATRTDGPESVAPLLQGVSWSWIPYTHPGIPLAIRIREEQQLDVLILENHGLVVAAENCDAAEALLHDVERRLDAPVRQGQAPNLRSSAADWEVAPDEEVHALATSPESLQIAVGGTLFPDQCVYLGPAAAQVEPGEKIEEAIERYRRRFDFSPVFLLVAGAGVLTRRDMKRSARELLLCLNRAVARMPDPKRVQYLPASQVARLMNWDAEKYRIAMAQKEITK